MDNDVLLAQINETLLGIEEDGASSQGLVEALASTDDQTRKNMMVTLVVLAAIEKLEESEAGPVVFVPDAIRDQFRKVMGV